MVEEEGLAGRFGHAFEAIGSRDFDEIKVALESLGFTFRQGRDPNHWIYFHPLLKGDPIFKFPCNLYRPHGSRRGSTGISRHDQAKARQRVEALRTVVVSSQSEGGETDDEHQLS